MHDSEQEHSGITGCRVTYESTIFYNEANKFSIIVVKTNDPRIPLQACSGRYYGDRMSDDDVMQASMNRVSQDTERLTRRNMKLCVMEDVQTECLADPAFARLVMNPKKKMVNCFHYINRKAREYLEQEMRDNDEKPMDGGFGGDVPDELCYQWAREYFRDADAKEDAEPEEKFVSKTYNGKETKAGKKEKPKKVVPKPAPKPADEEQLTFGDFGTEEAAG